eukprot:m51a1_g10770 putative Na+/H+ antiporter NhaD type (610) ;mRNA; r:40312-42325
MSSPVATTALLALAAAALCAPRAAGSEQRETNHIFAVSSTVSDTYEYRKSTFVELEITFPPLAEALAPPGGNDGNGGSGSSAESDSDSDGSVRVCGDLDQERDNGTWGHCGTLFCFALRSEERTQHYEARPGRLCGGAYHAGWQHRLRLNSTSPRVLVLPALVQTAGLLGPAQVWVALALLVVTYLLMALETAHRTIVACGGVLATFVFLACSAKFPDIHAAAAWIDAGTILLLWSMMTIVSVLTPTGIFEFLAALCVRWSGGSVRRLVVILWLLTAGLSALLDNVTCCLLLGPITRKITDMLEISPVPILMGAAMLSNVGGVATLIGDPPNLIIGKMLNISFVGFVVNLLPCVIICMVPALLFLLFVWRKKIRGFKVVDVDKLMQENRIKDRPLAIKCAVVLACVLLLFFTQTLTGLEPAYSALIGAATLLLLSSRKHIEKTMEGIDWETLIFFSAIFVFIRGLGQLGLIRLFADALVSTMKSIPRSGQLPVAIVLLIWVSALASAFIDNVPWTVTMVSVIKVISQELDLPLSTLAWALSYGACLGGNGTSIGASANVVIVGLLRSWSYPVRFVYWLSIGLPLMFLTISIATAYMLIVYVALGFEWKL